MFNEDLQAQIEYLEKVLLKNTTIAEVLKIAPELGLPHWYLGAGAIAQTAWNELHGYPLEHGIKDCDLVYFDPDTSPQAQDVFIEKGKKLFASLPIPVEITNEARVYLWYKAEFGKDIKPYQSTEDAINTWPTTATAIGVRYKNANFQVYAPYGLDDLLGMIVRPNKTLVSKEVYEKKAERWRKVWPKLEIVAWEDS
jgi:uncharacterized protein